MTECRERGLSTARAVLSVLSFVAQSERGVSAREVAERLHKSLSTAYHLLASLEAEGFVARTGRAGCYRLVPDRLLSTGTASVSTDGPSPDLLGALRALMDRVFAVTGRRTCVGLLRADGVELVQDVGRQGQPRIGGLEQPRIQASAHAIAIGKVLLAGFERDTLRSWQARHGRRAFTRSTIVDPVALRRELADVQRRGLATDCGEYDPDFASLAVPVPDQSGRAVAVVAITVTRQQFAAERAVLGPALLGVARDLGPVRAG